jgi:electron transfer flavoprotein beta subunit
MKILVFIKLVPDLVEELSIDPGGTTLDTTWLRMIINEFDDHALEQAILLKEKSTSEVIVIAPEFDGVDEVLFTAFAKGADQVIKLSGEFSNTNNHALARAITPYINNIQPDLILTGVQANNDIDGSFGPILAACLDQPFIGYVSGVSLEDNKAIVRKEYPGGIIAEMSVSLPAVLGIQAAEQPPRYVAVSKVRQVMKTASLEEHHLDPFENTGSPKVNRMYQPETSAHAEMIEGNPEEIADQLVNVFREKGIL